MIADGSRGLAGGAGTTDKKEEEKKDDKDAKKKGGLFGKQTELEQGQRDEELPDGCVGGRARRRPGSRRGGRPQQEQAGRDGHPGRLAAFKKGIA